MPTDWLNHAGSRLEDAEKAAARQDLAGDLSSDAREYLRQCREHEETGKREQLALAAAKRRTVWSGIGLAGALVFIGVVGWLWRGAEAENDAAAKVIAVAKDITERLVRADPKQTEWQDKFHKELAAYRGAAPSLGLVRQWFRTGTITIEGEPFIESSILVELMAIMIEEEGGGSIEVERKHWGYPTTVFSNLLLGSIDLMPTYTGTVLSSHLGVRYDKVKKHSDSVWMRDVFERSPRARLLKQLGVFGYRNNFALVMLRSRAEELGLLSADSSAEMAEQPSISDLERVAKELNFELKIGIVSAFADPYREDGYEGLLKHYLGFDVLEKQILPHERLFDELRSARIDVVNALTTDAELYPRKGSPYVILEDDRDFFLDYYALPLARRAVIDDYPEVQRALEQLAGRIAEEEMVGWIREVKALGIDGEKLNGSEKMRADLNTRCRLFLKRKGLLLPSG